MKDQEALYWQFIHFEEQAAAIYMRMASRFATEDKALSSLWLDMGMQEKHHAGLLQFCLCEKLFVDTGPTDKQVRDLNNEFATLARRAEAPDLTVNDAFDIAIRMEDSEVNAIYIHLTDSLNASMYLWKRRITASLPDHTERLLAEGRKFGVPKNIMARLLCMKRTGGLEDTQPTSSETRGTI